MKMRGLTSQPKINMLIIIIAGLFFGWACTKKKSGPQLESFNSSPENQTFQKDFDFLEDYLDLVLLEDDSGEGKIIVSPGLQARVMTSTANGWSGKSYGWINKTLFTSGDTSIHINAYGGEERIWFGPEGGQYSIFFKKGDEFTLDNWITPRLIDLEPFDLIERSNSHALFSKSASLKNYSGFTFDLNIERKISILSQSEISKLLNLNQNENVKAVGYKTENTLKNIGNKTWEKSGGLLSIWILGMMNPSPNTTIVIPYIEGSSSQFGPVVNDDYFGKISSKRLKVTEKAIFFKADGNERGKIGVSFSRAKDIFGSYDSLENSLTLIKFNKPTEEELYVNSKWEIQTDPFNGDVINAYNDGPPGPGAAPLGPFYELETSSPAAELKVGEELHHIQYTFHFEGNFEALDDISKKTLGITLNEIKSALKE
jgi:hypothetical protein